MGCKIALSKNKISPRSSHTKQRLHDRFNRVRYSTFEVDLGFLVLLRDEHGDHHEGLLAAESNERCILFEDYSTAIIEGT